MKPIGIRLVTGRSLISIGAAIVFAFLLLFGGTPNRARAQNRPRSAQTPSPTATPVVTSANPQNPAGNNGGSAPNGQTPVQGPPDRIVPRLGEAPRPPVFRPKPTPNPKEEELDPNSIIKINADLVTLNVRVIDRNNRPIDNVHQNDFHVFEDGVAQPIEFFSREEVPITYGLAVDTSLSLRTQIQTVIDAAKTIISSNKRGDETFVESFISSDKIEIKQDFTPNKDDLLEAVDNLYLEGGQTAVIDGVYLAAEHVVEFRKGDDSDRRRRALIVITDGEDRLSYYKEAQLFARLREEDVQIYIIGFVNELDKEGGGLIKKSPHDRAVALINKMSTETGGHAYFPQSISELPGIANSIIRDMRTQYVVSYNPTNKTRDGSYRTIRVNIDDGPQHDKRIALTRTGRVAGREGEPSKTPAGTAARPTRGSTP